MIESTAKKISREYQENENFAPKQNERDCPMTSEKIHIIHAKA